MKAIEVLFSVFVVVLLVGVIGLALRGTVVSKMCEMTAPYEITLANGSTESFDGAGIDCETNGLLYTWMCILFVLGGVIGGIYTGVKSFTKGA